MILWWAILILDSFAYSCFHTVNPDSHFETSSSFTTDVTAPTPIATTPCTRRDASTCRKLTIDNGAVTYKPKLRPNGEGQPGTVASLTCKKGFTARNKAETSATCTAAPAYGSCLTSCVRVCPDPKSLFVNQDDQKTTLSATGVQQIGSIVFATCGPDDAIIETTFADGTKARQDEDLFDQIDTIALLCNSDGKYFTQMADNFEGEFPVITQGVIAHKLFCRGYYFLDNEDD